MNKFKVGDKVMDSQRGEGVVTHTVADRDNGNDDYPIMVRFGNGQTETYTPEGYVCFGVETQCLFHLEGYVPPSAPEPKRLPDLAVDTKMLAGKSGQHRHFSHWDSLGRCCCFDAGQTSFTAYGICAWDKWSVYKGDE